MILHCRLSHLIVRQCLLPACCSFLLGLLFWFWKRRQHGAPKRRLTSVGLSGVISRMIELLMNSVPVAPFDHFDSNTEHVIILYFSILLRCNLKTYWTEHVLWINLHKLTNLQSSFWNTVCVCVCVFVPVRVCAYMYILHTYLHTHTHTYIYIQYIYSYITRFNLIGSVQCANWFSSVGLHKAAATAAVSVGLFCAAMHMFGSYL
jgi:hypothetical protein